MGACPCSRFLSSESFEPLLGEELNSTSFLLLTSRKSFENSGAADFE